MRSVAVCFTNFGPYHLARLRALAHALAESRTRLIAYEMAGSQAIYPWMTARNEEPFTWVTLFPDRELEAIPSHACQREMKQALDRDQPDALGIVGYSRPESMAMLRWARGRGVPTVLMSESQRMDHPRVWWKEAIKRRRVTRFSAGLVGGPRHRDYLVDLGMPAERIALGYNAVDGASYAAAAERCRRDPSGRAGLPEAPYFLAVSRFVAEKNLVRLVEAYARYRDRTSEPPWDLVLCGDGPDAAEIGRAITSSGHASSIHRPGFLQAEPLARWYAFAGAFVHPSLMEPWGLVVNEAAACGLPLLVSDRAGCVETFVPEGAHSTGARLDGHAVDSLAEKLDWMSGRSVAERAAMGRRAAEIAQEWGPERFARGTVEAIAIASAHVRQSKRRSRNVIEV
ncbi:MAG: glycosyltransferase family 4 protein [Isosphaeraceae bacterium]